MSGYCEKQINYNYRHRAISTDESDHISSKYLSTNGTSVEKEVTSHAAMTLQ